MTAATARPNLFIIGAAKSGTTSLHYHLAAHPDVFMSEPKEPGHFVPEIDYYPRDREWYLGLFAAGAGHRYRGESSTHYTKLPVHTGVVERLAEFVDDDARFIYLMRDPVERAISHYWHDVRKLEEHRGILEALRERVDYTAFSDYRMQLVPYLEHFGKDRVLALTFESLTRDPEATLGTLFDWLGLPTPRVPEPLERRNARPDSFRRVRGRGLLDRFARSRLWDRISPLAPGWLKRLGHGLGYRDAEPESEPVEEAVAMLRPGMRRQAEELEALLGRSFPEWEVTLGTPREELR